MKKTCAFILVFVLVLPALLAGGCRESSAPAERELLFPPQEVAFKSHSELDRFLKELNYNWQSAQQGVPGFVLTTLPGDLEQITRSRTKKRLFYLSLLPMALMINEEIAKQRETLQGIIDRLEGGAGLSELETTQLFSLAENYRVEGDPRVDPDARQTLLQRVDIIPPSLLLAQAANESAYGTSRFAQAANNLFGEWTFTPGTGLVPEGRPEGESYEVRRFPTLLASLESYVNNLNTHWAYRDLRKKRQWLRQNQEPVTGLALATELELYSERRYDYVSEILDIIRYNQLGRFNEVPLRPFPRHDLYRPTKPTRAALIDQ